MSDFYYYKENERLFRFRLEADDTPPNPRENNDANIGTLMLWWGNYLLGDNEGKGDIDEVLEDLIRENVPQEKWDEEKLVYDMTTNDKRMLLMKYIVLIPCYIYEHGGLTISCGDVGYPYTDRWDGGIAGFIYTTKAKCLEMWGVKEMDDVSWRKRAYEELSTEVKTYDMYLTDSCYGYIVDEYNAEDDEWETEVDSCWGFLSDKWGEKLAREIADDSITDEPFISEDQAEVVKTVMRDIALEEKRERKIMAQADTIVAI